MSRSRSARAVLVTAGVALGALAASALAGSDGSSTTATGVVFHDADGDQKRDADEAGVPGVEVSNGSEVVLTNGEGRYALPVEDGTTIFITKPSGWMVPVDDRMLPQFYYNHFPAGSPYALRYGGVKPTGPLPESVDFALHTQDESGTFTSLTFADPQPASLAQIRAMTTDVIAELEGSGALFGLTVGDIVSGNLALYPAYHHAVARIGVPWWNLPGNHDMDLDAASDADATDTYIQTFGPTSYSFEYGDVHFVALDNVEKIGTGRAYRGLLTPEQLDWVERDLAHVPRDKLVVVATHIPLVDGADPAAATGNTAGRERLFALLADRRHVYSVAGHRTANTWQNYLGPDDGWHGKDPLLHHVLAEVRGGGWERGPQDGRGIHQADMADGTPNGYYTFTWDGTDFAPQYKAASLPADFLMRISYRDDDRAYVPAGPSGSGDFAEPVVWRQDQLAAGDDGAHPVVDVDVFDGGERNVVEMSIDGRPFTTMSHLGPTPDDYATYLRKRQAGTGDAAVVPRPSSHLWSAPVPGGLSPGVHRVTVRSTSAWGQVAVRTSEFTIAAGKP